MVAASVVGTIRYGSNDTGRESPMEGLPIAGLGGIAMLRHVSFSMVCTCICIPPAQFPRNL